MIETYSLMLTISTMGEKNLRICKDQSIDLSGLSIDVVVGLEPNPITFSVHENLICASSDFFKKAFNGDWQEARERSVRLEKEDPETFEVYIHWLYRQTLPVRIDEPGHPGNVEYVQLANCYVLGDMLQDLQFKNVIIDAIVDKTTTKAVDGSCWYPVGPVIRYIYDNTMERSKARRLLVDLYTYAGQAAWLTDWSTQEELPKEFLFDLATAALTRRPKPTLITEDDGCKYHEHFPDDPSPCYKK